jgi:hypothetical protein
MLFIDGSLVRQDTLTAHEYDGGEAARSESFKTDQKVFRHLRERPGDFVFMVQGLDGYWIIREGRAYKFVSGRLRDANQYLLRHYGQDYIRDQANLMGMRIGYPYYSCPIVSYPKRKKIVLLMAPMPVP